MGKEEHVHNHTVNEVLNPIGRNSDDTKNVYAVEDHYFCSCGDFYTRPKGTREM
jgi:hypothetical protein